MTTLKGKPVTVNCSQETAFKYICDLNNFEHLLPTERLSDFKSTAEECSFKAQGSFFIGLVIDSKNEFDRVTYKTTDKSAIKFKLNVHLKQLGDNQIEIEQICDAELNPFLKMMIEKPLLKLFDYISERMVAIHS